MNPQVKQLIPAIVSYINEHRGYVTKTKLLKLLYLFDVEFYRVNRRLFTGFDWKFFHLGPWTREFDPVVDELVSHGVLLQVQSAKPEYDTKFFRTETPTDFSGLFSSFRDEAPLRTVLNIWGDRSTGEILDHVYFRTEPMEHGIRNAPLDFSVIPDERPEKYARTSSGLNSRQISALKKEFSAKLAALKKAQAANQFEFTLPRYDEEFLKVIDKLDAAES
jgi:hypothetical protein